MSEQQLSLFDEIPTPVEKSKRREASKYIHAGCDMEGKLPLFSKGVATVFRKDGRFFGYYKDATKEYEGTCNMMLLAQTLRENPSVPGITKEKTLKFGLTTLQAEVVALRYEAVQLWEWTNDGWKAVEREELTG